MSGTQTASTGTALTLGAALNGARTFANAYGANKTNITVAIDDGANWQVGVATFSNDAGTLTFTAIDASSANGSAITLSGSATVAVTYLTRDHDADWPFMNATFNSGTQNITSGGFNTITYGNLVSDTHGAMNISTGIYTVPQAGVYDILVKFRASDGNLNGNSYGVGSGTANSDGAEFQWYVGAPQRQGAIYRRISAFAQGDQLRAFYYADFNSNVSAAAFSIVRIR